MASEQQTLVNRSFYLDAAGYDAIDKRAGEVTDYSVDYTSNLDAGDALSTSVWSADSGLTVDSDSNTTTVARVWISGGTVGASYKLTNTVTTANGRTKTRIIRVYVRA